eukprot:2131672-Pleurochrysis_carterae.AAC.2
MLGRLYFVQSAKHANVFFLLKGASTCSGICVPLSWYFPRPSWCFPRPSWYFPRPSWCFPRPSWYFATASLPPCLHPAAQTPPFPLLTPSPLSLRRRAPSHPVR